MCDQSREQASQADPIAAAADLPRPFQFGLRAMFGGVAALSALFAVMGAVGMVWSVILVWFLLLVVAHVTANAWGTRAGRRVVPPPRDEPTEPAPPVEHCGIVSAGAAARLRETKRPGWPMVVVTALGALVGGALALAALVVLSLERSGYAGVVVGTVSAAAVGGFLGFLASSFAEVARHAWQEAVEGAAPTKTTSSS